MAGPQVLLIGFLFLATYTLARNLKHLCFTANFSVVIFHFPKPTCSCLCWEVGSLILHSPGLHPISPSFPVVRHFSHMLPNMLSSGSPCSSFLVIDPLQIFSTLLPFPSTAFSDLHHSPQTPPPIPHHSHSKKSRCYQIEAFKKIFFLSTRIPSSTGKLLLCSLLTSCPSALSCGPRLSLLRVSTPKVFLFSPFWLTYSSQFINMLKFLVSLLKTNKTNKTPLNFMSCCSNFYLIFLIAMLCPF